jgi:hypothetical protein
VRDMPAELLRSSRVAKSVFANKAVHAVAFK